MKLTEFFPRANSNALVVSGSLHDSQVFEVEEIDLSIMPTRSRKLPGLDRMNGEVVKIIWAAIPHRLMIFIVNYEKRNNLSCSNNK